MSRKKIVAGNWKMNTTMASAESLVTEIIAQLPALNDNTQVIIAPPYTHLHTMREWLKNTPIQLAAQNCHHEEKGAFTGEISPAMLAEMGITNVILGHSERREYFGENEELLSKKVQIALNHGLQVIYCIGEKLESREAGQQENVVAQQLSILSTLTSDQMNHIVLAYEPVWAIGTGKTATSQQAQDMHAFIRKQVAQYFDDSIAENMTILYGGSCNAQNADELFAMPDVDGGLIGGAALKSVDFTSIINSRNN